MKDIQLLKKEEVASTLSHFHHSYLEMKKLKHDLYDQLSIIGTLLYDKKYEEANQYFEKIYHQLKEIPMYQITGDLYLDIYLRHCIETYSNININFQSTSLSSYQSISYDFYSLIINLLNNAIESTQQYNNENSKVEFVLKIENDQIIIKCSNYTPINPFTTDFQTTKTMTENHGYGHIIIKDIISKHHGDMHYTYDQNILTLYIIANTSILKETESIH